MLFQWFWITHISGEYTYWCLDNVGKSVKPKKSKINFSRTLKVKYDPGIKTCEKHKRQKYYTNIMQCFKQHTFSHSLSYTVKRNKQNKKFSMQLMVSFLKNSNEICL